MNSTLRILSEKYPTIFNDRYPTGYTILMPISLLANSSFHQLADFVGKFINGEYTVDETHIWRNYRDSPTDIDHNLENIAGNDATADKIITAVYESVFISTF